MSFDDEYPMEYPLIRNNLPKRNFRTINNSISQTTNLQNQQNNQQNNIDVKLMRTMVKEIMAINEESIQEQIKKAEEKIEIKYMKCLNLILILFIICVIIIVLLFSFGIITINRN